MKTDRLLAILSILANTEKITIKALSDRFEVSKRTISRDIDALNQAGIPIVSYAGAQGGIGIMEGYRLDKQIFSTQDFSNLLSSIQGLQSIVTDSNFTNLLAKVLPQQDPALIAQSDWMIDFSSWFADALVMPRIQVFYPAIQSCERMEMEYISKSGRITRTVQPYKLIFKRSSWYLYAFCETKQDFRLFHLKRIATLAPTGTYFEKQPLSEITLGNDFGIDIYSAQPQLNWTRVVLSYRKQDEFFLSTRVDSSFLNRNPTAETGTIKFYVPDIASIVDFIYALEDKVVVLEPQALRRALSEKAKYILSLYNDDI